MLLSEEIKTMENEHKEFEMCLFGELKIPGYGFYFNKIDPSQVRDGKIVMSHIRYSMANRPVFSIVCSSNFSSLKE